MYTLLSGNCSVEEGVPMLPSSEDSPADSESAILSATPPHYGLPPVMNNQQLSDSPALPSPDSLNVQPVHSTSVNETVSASIADGQSECNSLPCPAPEPVMTFLL